MRQPNLIAPSILSANFAKLGEDVANVLKAGADIIHFDVMDNHYVPNLTVGSLVCRSLRDYGIKAEIDVHLMVSPVDRIILDFAKAGASYISFHQDASQDVNKTIKLIKDNGCKAGIVFSPDAPMDSLDGIIEQLDMVLIMGVSPGFGGQSFIPETLNRLKMVRKMIDDKGLNTRLEVDGGVNADNIQQIAAAGADTFVAGFAIFGADNYEKVISKMRQEIAKIN